MVGERDEGHNPEHNTDQAISERHNRGASDSGRTSAGRALPVKALVESLLFVADEPVQLSHLATTLNANTEQIQAALDELASDYNQQRGVRLQFTRQRVQMVSAPEASEEVRRFLGLELDGRLSPAALETLAIVAYLQPVTRSQVEAIRGVNSDSVLRTLLNRGLIEDLGRLDQAGRPIIYGTTFEFLQQFGLTSLEQLPALEVVGDLASP
jgi:segregation and condensation protein B